MIQQLRAPFNSALRGRRPLFALCALITAHQLGCEPSASTQEVASPAVQLTTHQDKVVYGTDSRRDYYELTSANDTLWRARARYSTGVLVRPSYVSSQGGQVELQGDTLGESQGLCADEKFYNQPEPGFCSGTLISDDLFLTAGHCIDDAADCANTMIAFQYVYTDPQSINSLTQSDLYQCQSVVTRRNSNGYDYAIVRLDRTAAPHLEPAPINFEARPLALGDQLTLIGAPNGIPIKVDSEGQVTTVGTSNVTFKGSVDAFGGNSGSAIYNASGEVVGILVQGRPDYYTDQTAGCRRVNQVDVDAQGQPTDGNGAETGVYVGRAIDALCSASPTHSICVERAQEIGGGEGGTSGETGGSEPPALCEDSFEPDDSSTQANTVTFGVTQAHTFCDDPTDWVRFSTDRDLLVDVETYRVGVLGAGDQSAPFLALTEPSDAPAPNTEVTLYDAELLLIDVDDDSGDGQLSSLSAVSASVGSYLVRLRDTQSASATDGYAVMVREHCQEDSFEALPEPFSHHQDDYPSDILPALPIPSTQAGSLCDEDWRRIEVSAELVIQSLTIHAETSVEQPTDTILTLYGPDGTALVSNDDAPGLGLGSAIDWTPESPGSYWLRVRGYRDSYGLDRPYTLTVNTPEVCDQLDNDQDGVIDEGLSGCQTCEPDPYEENDSLAEAVGVGLGYTIPLNHCLDAEDWFSFTLSVGQRVDIETSVRMSSDTIISLYDRQGQRLRENDDASNQTYGSLISQFEAPYTGGYWLRVLQYNQNIGPATPYELLIRQSCADDSVEPDDQALEAPLWTPTSGRDLVEDRSLCDPDWIRFEATAGQRFSFDVSQVINASISLTISRDFGRIPLNSVSDDASEGALSLTWEAPITGSYWVELTSLDGSYGGDSSYRLTGRVFPSEQCNAQDDDQDGAIDEGVSNACGACGPVPTERCDSIDNDCDGRTDEGTLNACGACGEVPQELCDEEDNDCDGRVDEGALNACGACGEVPDEVCDGLDNDCDQSIDEGVLNACGRCGPLPVELCDGVDNDCDGLSDEGLPVNACGACGPAPIESCDEIDNDCDGLVDEGLRNQCGLCGEPPTETCDGVDEDCDGEVDEGLLNACGTCGATPPELCDELYQGSDDDCDGVVDEGCALPGEGGAPAGGSPEGGSSGRTEGSVEGGVAGGVEVSAGSEVVIGPEQGGATGAGAVGASQDEQVIDETDMHIEVGCQGARGSRAPHEGLIFLLLVAVCSRVRRLRTT